MTNQTETLVSIWNIVNHARLTKDTSQLEMAEFLLTPIILSDKDALMNAIENQISEV